MSVHETKTNLSKPPKDWDRFVARFLEEYFQFNPTYAVWAGRHEFDGQLPDLSGDGIESMADQLVSARTSAQAFDPETLTEAQRFERAYLIAVLDGELFWLADTDWQRKIPLAFTRQLSPDVYLTREYAPLDQRMSAFITYANNLPRALRQLRKYLRPPLARPALETAIQVYRGLAALFAELVPVLFQSVEDQRLQSELSEANQNALNAVRYLIAWLRDHRSSAENNYVMGVDLYQEMLWKTQRVDMPLDDLKSLGEQDLERNLTALREVCKGYMPASTVADCVRAVMAKKPKEGPVKRAGRQLADLQRFLVESDIVSIPGAESARVAEAPPHQRWNSAYIAIPGPYEKNLPSVYYIAPPDPGWSPEEQQAYLPGEADLLFTSIHEVWPGHFLQVLHAKRTPSMIGRLFSNYAFSEGWAHYAEELMWEAGYGNQDPEVHIGELVNALMRNVRLLASIGLHTRGMTVAEAERMFRESAFIDPGNARQQAARGTLDPGYLNYTLGKLLIRQLREDWTASRGGRSVWKAFHDQFLSYGTPPIPLVREAILG